MSLLPKATILDAPEMRRVIRRMAGEIVETGRHRDGLMLIGIRTRGVPFAEQLANEIEQLEGVRPPIGTLDITLYRDDLTLVAPKPLVKESSFPEPIHDQTLVLCDDVLYTGRTIGISTNMIVARSDYPVDRDLCDKIALFCDVETRAVVPMVTSDVLYEIPLMLESAGVGDYLEQNLNMKATRKPDMKPWE